MFTPSTPSAPAAPRIPRSHLRRTSSNTIAAAAGNDVNLTAHAPTKLPTLRWKSEVSGRLHRPFAFAMLMMLFGAVGLIAIANGAYALSLTQVVAGSVKLIGLGGLLPPGVIEDGPYAVLSSIRVPRVLFGLAVGASLAVAGTALQSLFRNPLADPGLIGVSAGAALAVASVIVLGATTLKGLSQALGAATLPVAGFAGGMVTTFIIYLLAQSEGRTSLVTMLLAGIAVNALAAAGIGLYTVIATDEQLRNLTFWTFGSLGGAQWKTLGVLATTSIIGIALLWRIAPGLNALMFGETEARHLGYDVNRLKRTVIIVTALLTGVAVSLSGVIGFVALLAPHAVRLLLGPDVRYLIPASALLGGAFLVGADLVARTMLAPAELPLGVVTAFIGAPFFIALIASQRRTLGA
jgi:iron complex transport system permease protein